MNKFFILAVIALNLNLICGQHLITRGAVARGVPAWGGAWGGRAAWAAPALVGGYGLAGHNGYAAYGGYGLGARAWGTHLGGIGLAAPAGLAVARHATVGLAAPAYANVAGLGYGLGLRAAHVGVVGHTQHVGPVSAAIETRRTHQVIDVPTSQDVIQPSTLIVEPNVMPVNIEFRSQSSPVNVNQVHIPGRPGEVQHTSSEEEADRLVHEVVKPVIQEVRETIVPFRRITQEVLPVQEEVHSLVARGQRQQVLAQPQVVAQPVAARVAVAAPAVGLVAARPAAVGVVARPAVGLVAAPVATGIVAQPALAGGIVTTGISRFGGALGGVVGGLNGGLVRGLPAGLELIRAARS